MQFTQVIASAVLLFAVTGYSAPVPQLAGEGAAADSLLSGTDNAVGYGTENAENKLAGNIASVTGNTYDAGGAGSSGGSGGGPPPPPPHKRQLAGEGAAANSLLSGTDNAVGYGTENAENKLAGNIASVTGNSYDAGGAGSSGGSGGGPPPPPPHKRQLDKIANGAGAIGQAAGVSAATAPVVTQADNLDGTLTSGAADAGAQIADEEVSTAEAAGNAVPKTRRQLDKIANGAGAIGQAAGVSAATGPVVTTSDNLDGTLTSGAADAGAQIADTEVKTAEDAGNAVP